MVILHGCSSSNSPSSEMAEDEPEGRTGAAADRMVKIELEAAETLADLAHFATRDPETGVDSSGKWGSKGKRATKRVKGESPAAVDCWFNSVDSAPKCSTNRSEDRPVVDQKELDNLSRIVTAKLPKSEQKAGLQRPCSASHSSFGGCRSRQNLTEAEREERKIRRILANRESARQTIRRRQALCEELAKKAADLSQENENLKREKESALKEYKSLETTNRNLKAQVAKATKAELEVGRVAEETQCEAKSGQGDVATPPKNCPLLLYDRPPFAPLLWPAMVQSSNLSQSQHRPPNPPFLPPNVPVPVFSKPEFSNKQENLVNINGPMTPIYLLPCPWFFPLPDHAHGLHSQTLFCVNDKQEENSVSNRSSGCISSKNVAYFELNSPALSIKAKAEDSGSVEAGPVKDLNETPVGFSENGGGSNNRTFCKETFLSLATASCSSVQPSSTDKRAESNFTANAEAISSTASRNVYSVPEQKQEQDLHLCQKSMEAFAAAEARRRRKELTKLKNLHNRHHRMQC